MSELGKLPAVKPHVAAAGVIAAGCVVGAAVAYLLQPYFMSRAVRRAWAEVERYRDANDDDGDKEQRVSVVDVFGFGSEADEDDSEYEYEYEYEYDQDYDDSDEGGGERVAVAGLL